MAETKAVRRRYVRLVGSSFYFSKGVHYYLGLKKEKLQFEINKSDLTLSKSQKGYDLKFYPSASSYSFRDCNLAKAIRINFNLEGKIYFKVDAKGNEFKLTPNV